MDATWSDLDGYIGTFAIASGAVIENAITGSGDDHVTGNTAANDIQTGEGADTIVAGAGDDTINGGAGEDTVVFTGASADYGLIWDGALWITDTDLTDGDDGTDMLTGVETLSFADGSYGTMYSGTSKITVRLYDNENSVAKETLEIDSANKHKWNTIVQTYDASGEVAVQTNVFDDGRAEQSCHRLGRSLRPPDLKNAKRPAIAWPGVCSIWSGQVRQNALSARFRAMSAWLPEPSSLCPAG